MWLTDTCMRTIYLGPFFFVSATIIHIKNAILFKFFHLDFSSEILRPKLISIPYISLFNSIHFQIKSQKKELKIFAWKKNIRNNRKKWRSQWIKLRKASVFFPLERLKTVCNLKWDMQSTIKRKPSVCTINCIASHFNKNIEISTIYWLDRTEPNRAKLHRQWYRKETPFKHCF